jgi:exonuclease SbcD
MRILHTGDWHVGKKLGRIDRSKESEAVLDELVEVARDQEVDLVIVAGDLFDRGLPPFASLRLVLDTLVRLADTGARVVAIPGNHDSPDLFEVLTPHLAHSNVTLRHKTFRPEAGGVVQVPSRDGTETAQVACFPFLHESTVVEWTEAGEEKHKSYADRVRDICKAYADWMMANGPGATVDLLAAHFMVHGAVPSGSERELHIGEAYMARENAVPNVHYSALGHIHQAQGAPGSADRARYCGSLMQLDFGEAGQDKSVVVVDVSPDGRRKIEQIPITSGRSLVRVRGTLDEIAAKKDENPGAILAVDVVTEGPAPGIAEQVRDLLGDAVLYVRADYPRMESTLATREGMSLDDLYSAYVEKRYGSTAPDELLAAFRELQEELGVRA